MVGIFGYFAFDFFGILFVSGEVPPGVVVET
jgi:hypothetical protein